MELRQQGVFNRTSKVYFKHFPGIILLSMGHLLLRAAAFSPLIIAAVTGKFFQVTPDHAIAVALLASLPLYLLIAMPFRYQYRAQLSAYLGKERDSRVTFSNYKTWLAAGLTRLIRSLPFLLPLIAFVVLYYYYMRIADLTRLPLLILDLGMLVGGSFSEGTAILILIGLAAFLIAMCGWRRSLLFEGQPVLERGIRPSWRRSRELRRQARPVSLINFLLWLPSALAFGAVVGLNLTQDLTGSVFEKILALLPAIFNMDLSSAAYYQLLIVLVVLYLPLMALRKLMLCTVDDAA